LKKKEQVGYNHQYVGGDYDAQIGFVPRTDFFRVNPDVRVNFQPSNDVINQHGPGIEYNRFMDTDFRRTDESFDLTYQVQFQNNTRLNFRYRNSYTLLTSDFEIISDQPALTVIEENLSHTPLILYSEPFLMLIYLDSTWMLPIAFNHSAP